MLREHMVWFTERHSFLHLRQGVVHAKTARQLLTVDATDAAVLDGRCGPPVAPADRKYCSALTRTLARCRHSFGRFTLRCSHTTATACSTSLAQIRGGRCGASSDPHLPSCLALR